jgi:hypothetical protein
VIKKMLGISFALLLGVGCASTPVSQQEASLSATQKVSTPKMIHAVGTFEVQLKPLPAYNQSVESKLSRMSIDKQFHGDLEGTSQGEMLIAATATQGSAGYVAIERVEGVLHGRSGSFSLQHNATMNRGTPELNIIVVPDSATGELSGLSGNMRIIIADGKHSFEFDYSLPDGK